MDSVFDFLTFLKSNSKKFYFSFLLLTSTFFCFTQNLEIKQVSWIGKDVVVLYDLLDDNLDHRYTLNLYSSEDDFIKPLKEVEGDIGIDQEVGGNKKIIWHAGEELGSGYKGLISLELKGKLYIPFVSFNDFDQISKLKRNRPTFITWSAGRGSSVLTWNLINKNDEIVHTFTNVANVGEYEMIIPKDVKPGKGYYLRVSDQNNKEDVVETPPFQVQRRVPMYVNVALATLTGGVIYLVIAELSNPTPEQTELPVLSTPK